MIHPIKDEYKKYFDMIKEKEISIKKIAKIIALHHVEELNKTYFKNSKFFLITDTEKENWVFFRIVNENNEYPKSLYPKDIKNFEEFQKNLENLVDILSDYIFIRIQFFFHDY